MINFLTPNATLLHLSADNFQKALWQKEKFLVARTISPFATMIFFSTPEHEVLRVSYCDRFSSVVRRPFVCPSVRSQFQTSSPPKPLGQFQPNFTGMIIGWSSIRFLIIMPPVLKIALPSGLSVFHNKIFENLLLLNHCANFNQISQECSLGCPLSDS